jgi:hypothetical protein
MVQLCAQLLAQFYRNDLLMQGRKSIARLGDLGEQSLRKQMADDTKMHVRQVS